MTIERRCTIEPADFLALIFECGECGAASRVPVTRIAEGKFESLSTRNCFQCGADTGIRSGTMEYVHISNFALALRQLAEATKGRNAKIKLELKCEDFEAKQ